MSKESKATGRKAVVFLPIGKATGINTWLAPGLQAKILLFASAACFMVSLFPPRACAGVLFGKTYHESLRKYLARAENSVTVALLLCKLQRETGKSSFDIDYGSLAKRMGYETPQELGKYRDEARYFYERTHRSLKRLRGYGLIDYKKGKVALKANNIKKANEPRIIIPFEYWEYGYPGTLSMRAKYMYLVCLYEAARSTKYPFWFRSQEDMAKLYGISDTTISLGLLELEERGIIEITRDDLTPPDFSGRKANVYRMLALSRQSKLPAQK